MANVDPNGAMVVAGLLNPDGSVSDAAREKFISTHEEFSKKGSINLPFPCVPKASPNPFFNPNLRDRDAYGAWHNRWIDGSYRSVLLSLNSPSNFAIPPIVDVSAVALKLGINIDIDAISLPSLLVAFAAPIPTIPKLLGIKTPDIPNFIPKLTGLLSLPKLPSLDLPDFPKIDMSIDASYKGFMLELQLAFPKIAVNLFKEFSLPDLYVNFDALKFFEIGCKVVSEALPKPKVEFTPTFDANKATLTVVQSDAHVIHAVSQIIGAGKIINAMSEKRGYKTLKTGPDDLDSEALQNGLVRLEPNEKNIAIILPQRKVSYGDPFTIDYINALADHMYEVFPDYVLEIGNLTGKGAEGKGPNWRFQPWTAKTHKGGSFDMAYPMRDNGLNGNFVSAVVDRKIAGKKKPAQQGAPGSVQGENEGAISQGYGGVDFTNPYAGDPAKMLNYYSGKYAWDVLYEMARWTFEDYMPSVMNDGLIVDSSGKKAKYFPVNTFVIGDELSVPFFAWTQANGKSTTKSIKGLAGNGATSYFAPQKNHNDHIHVNVSRTERSSVLVNQRATYSYAYKGVEGHAPGSNDDSSDSPGYYNWKVAEVSTGISSDDPKKKVRL